MSRLQSWYPCLAVRGIVVWQERVFTCGTWLGLSAWPEEVDTVVDVRVTVVLLVVEEILAGEAVVVAVVVSVPRRSDTRLWHTSFGRRDCGLAKAGVHGSVQSSSQ